MSTTIASSTSARRAARAIRIGDRTVGDAARVYVIAEAGVNHNGDPRLALRLIEAAAAAGADAVKFQTFRAADVVTRDGETADYQRSNTGRTESQRVLLERLELAEPCYPELLSACRARGIQFLSTPHGGMPSADFLRTCNLGAYKFGSGDLNNHPLLEHVARFGKPMLLGTGMATLDEVRAAVGVIRAAGNDDIVVLHCTSNYPCPDDEVNLRALATLRDELDVLAGYSDHTPGLQVPVMAVALGACVIEKHFTLDRELPGPDHRASLLPVELTEMVRAIRRAEVILGSAEKQPARGELATRRIARKSIVAARAIRRGEAFTAENLAIKRPGTGLEPARLREFVGRRATRDLAPDELLGEGDRA